MSELNYLNGFGNHFQTEALKGALPEGQNTPQKLKYGLYAEQLSGTAFTAVRSENRRSWLYRIRPSVMQGEFRPYEGKGLLVAPPFDGTVPTPNQYRWDPMPDAPKGVDFIDSWVTIVGNGSPDAGVGVAAHWYNCNTDMKDRAFYNSDAETIIIPYRGRLHIETEMGQLEVEPTWFTVIPRGVKFKVSVPDGMSAGYVGENFGEHLRLPNLGPIGANGLANARDFESPVASYDDYEGSYELITKFSGRLYVCELDHSPFDVVAWHGELTPYRYDLKKFNAIGSISYDHPDPSIFTVLTSPANTTGTANLDFVLFPYRWMVAEGTFRPPYYHRNVMSEFMGNIQGTYDAKEKGFKVGGASLHNCMSSHGPEAAVFEKASSEDLKPVKYGDSLAFMFESRFPFQVSKTAHEASFKQNDYMDCWKGLKKHFTK